MCRRRRRPDPLRGGRRADHLQHQHRQRRRIGRRAPDGTFTDYGGLTAGAHPSTIIQGPDGNLWFLEPGIDSIGRIARATPGVAHSIELGGFSLVSGARGSNTASVIVIMRPWDERGTDQAIPAVIAKLQP